MDGDSSNTHNPPNPSESGGRDPAQPGYLEQFLSSLFAGRLLSASPANDDVGSSANTLIPFFGADVVFASANDSAQEHSNENNIGSTTTSPPMQSVPNVVFCAEDTVGLKDDKYQIGVVDRSFGDVDTHQPRPQRDYSEEIERHADIPRQDFAKFMKTGIPPRGTVLISWQTQVKTELIPETRLQLLDRALLIGDVVKRAAEEHISGTVIGTKAVCSLFPAVHYKGGQITQTASDDLSIRSVPSEELFHVHEFHEGGIVVYDDWVGRIESLFDEVTIRLSNNSVVVVEDPTELEHDDVNMDRFSVGDTVKTKKGNLRRGRWRYGAFDANVRPEGTVVETRTVEMQVQWLVRSLQRRFDGDVSTEPPVTLGRDEFEGPTFFKYDASCGSATTLPMSLNSNETLFHVPELAVGDRVAFKDIAAASVKYDGTHTLPNGYPQGKLTRIPRTESLGYDLNVYLVMQTHTQVTVQWQDLTTTTDLSIALVPDINVEIEDEVWPGEIVLSKEEREANSSDLSWTKKPAKVGVVQAIQSRDRIAQVRWFLNPSIEFYGPNLLPPGYTGELNETAEDVSLYDIYALPALTRRRNDFVLIQQNFIPTLQSDPAMIGPNWFGEVVDLGLDGQVTVRLGAAKPVIDVQLPCEGVVLVSSRDFEYENMDMEEYDDSLEDSEEDVSDFDSASFNEMWIEYEGMDGDHPIGNEEDWSTEDEEEDSDDDESIPDFVGVEDMDTSITTPETKSPQNKQDQQMEGTQESETTGTQEQPVQTGDQLTPFLILDSPPPLDLHYISHPVVTSPNFMRRVAKEHKILRGALPPNILVRTWESRLDLIRVLIIGPNDTPYEFAPFVIDFLLPPTYPQQAPIAYFHSWTNGNGPVNPNLYEDGKICLSLLGTWHADERNESWSPSKSTLLQVLVSIMGLVLVKEPYYNEAGYDVHRSAPETKLNSAVYTERAYFRTRAFIHHALTNDVKPFKNELDYLYNSQAKGAPRLLEKAIEAAKEVVQSSENNGNEGERDGLRMISLGAVVMLKRQIVNLEALIRAA